MAIPTSRTKEAADIFISEETCTGCGLCVKVCGDESLIIENGIAAKSNNALFGCIGCGHCMAICPEDAILIKGREVASSDFFDLPDREKATGYEQLSALLNRRRSMRKFSNKEIDKEMIEKILVAARTAPMGLPPSDVNVMILDSREKNRAFAREFCEYMEGMQWFVSEWFLTLMRPLWGKVNDEMFRGFIRPMVKLFPRKMREGENVLNYDAPLSMYFYGTPYTDPADPVIAATYAMIAGESLGLGTCMIGSVHPFIQNGKKARLFREKYNIKYMSKEGLIVLFGYPAIKYRKGIRRTFANITGSV